MRTLILLFTLCALGPNALNAGVSPLRTMIRTREFVTSFVYQDLYDFKPTGGFNPVNDAPLVIAIDGKFYGTTVRGPSSGFGTLFSIQSDGTGYTDVVSSWGAAGNDEVAGLNYVSGNLYGVSRTNGSGDNGTLFQSTTTGTITILHSFVTGEDGGSSIPVQGKDGNLYGFTTSGLPYRVTLPVGTYQLLQTATVVIPTGQLTLASDGELYGVGQVYGPGNSAVFRVSKTGVVTILHTFSGSDGYTPWGPLVEGSNGNIYGATADGGLNGSGVIYTMSKTGASFAVLHNMDALSSGVNNDGTYAGGLMLASDGNFYGITSLGGASTYGTIFQVTQSGAFTKLIDFTGYAPIRGAGANTTLVQAPDGCLYGLTTDANVTTGFGNFYNLCANNVLVQIVKVAGPVFVKPGIPVQVVGENMSHVVQVRFGQVQGSFRPGSDTYLTAIVPSNALDGPVSVVYDTGLAVQSVGSEHIVPSITNFDPSVGQAGTRVQIVGGGFAGATQVTFNGQRASFTVLTPSTIQATVPRGASTGRIAVTTPNGVARSTQVFTVR